MSNTTDIDDIEDTDAPTREATAFQTEQRTWKGIPLAPFAIDRYGKWLEHRHQIGAPLLAHIIRDVGAMALDAMRVLWFCAHDPKEWLTAPDGEHGTDLRWRRYTPTERAQRLEERINEWGREHINSDEIPEAVKLIYEIYSSANETRPTIASDGRKHDAGN